MTNEEILDLINKIDSIKGSINESLSEIEIKTKEMSILTNNLRDILIQRIETKNRLEVK